MDKVKAIILSLIIASAMLAAAGFTLSNDTIPPQTAVTDSADLIIADLWPVIQDKQVLYHASNGQFYQGLVTHSMIPTDGISLTLDMAYSHPTDQTATWVDFFGPELPTKLPFAVVIETYSTATDSGFTAYFRLAELGNVYERSLGTGTQGRNEDWHQLPDITPP